jgi:hypothetical protein
MRELRVKRGRNRRATPRRHAAAMKLMHHRGYLRALTPAQRRSWFEQRKRLMPRVPIGSSWVPDRVRRSYTYANRI